MASTGGVTTLAEHARSGGGAGKSLLRLGWERFLTKKLALFSLFLILLFYTGGVFGPMVAPYGYREQNLDNQFQPGWLTQPFCVVTGIFDPNRAPPKIQPSPEHLLGTDRLGRDLFSRMLWGMRTSVIVSFATIVTGSILLGVGLGALTGYFRGKLDGVVSRVGEVFLAFPGLLLVILISATVRPRVLEWARGNPGLSGLVESGFVDYVTVFGAMSVFSWVGVSRIIRGQILLLREMDYVTAARALGAKTPRLLFVHLLPNTLNIIIIILSGALGGAIGSELVLSWLGVGIQPPQPSLALMIYENQSQSLLVDQFACKVAPVFLAPIFLVSVVFFSFALLGDGLNDAFNPRSRRG